MSAICCVREAGFIVVFSTRVVLAQAERGMMTPGFIVARVLDPAREVRGSFG